MHSPKRYLNGQIQRLSVPNTLKETKTCNLHPKRDDEHLCHLYRSLPLDLISTPLPLLSAALKESLFKEDQRTDPGDETA